jgi:hypothetical protein
MVKCDADVAERFAAMIEHSARRSVFSIYSRVPARKSAKKIHNAARHKGRRYFSSRSIHLSGLFRYPVYCQP